MWIPKRERCRQEVVLVEVENRAVEGPQALRVHEYLCAAGAFEDVIGLSRGIVPGELITVARTPAGFHGDAKSTGGSLLFLELSIDDSRRTIGNLNHGCSLFAIRCSQFAIKLAPSAEAGQHLRRPRSRLHQSRPQSSIYQTPNE